MEWLLLTKLEKYKTNTTSSGLKFPGQDWSQKTSECFKENLISYSVRTGVFCNQHLILPEAELQCKLNSQHLKIILCCIVSSLSYHYLISLFILYLNINSSLLIWSFNFNLSDINIAICAFFLDVITSFLSDVSNRKYHYMSTLCITQALINSI